MNSDRIALLVDDATDYLDVMALNLPRGLRAVCAISLADAKQKAQLYSLAIAVVDVRLNETVPGNTDGLTLLAWLKSKYQTVPVIMISGYSGFEYRAKSLALGAELFLDKPLRPEEFTRAVCQLAGAGS
jgi:DNA-binding NtrC family response regulator